MYINAGCIYGGAAQGDEHHVLALVQQLFDSVSALAMSLIHSSHVLGHGHVNHNLLFFIQIHNIIHYCFSS